MTSQIREYEVAGAVFWIVVYGLVNLANAADGVATGYNMVANILVAVFAIVLFVLAYFSQKRKAWSFLVTMVIGSFLVIGTLAADGLGTVALTDSMEVFVGIPTVYAAYLGFLRVRTSL